MSTDAPTGDRALHDHCMDVLPILSFVLGITTIILRDHNARPPTECVYHCRAPTNQRQSSWMLKSMFLSALSDILSRSIYPSRPTSPLFLIPQLWYYSSLIGYCVLQKFPVLEGSSHTSRFVGVKILSYILVAMVVLKFYMNGKHGLRVDALAFSLPFALNMSIFLHVLIGLVLSPFFSSYGWRCQVLGEDDWTSKV